MFYKANNRMLNSEFICMYMKLKNRLAKLNIDKTIYYLQNIKNQQIFI